MYLVTNYILAYNYFSTFDRPSFIFLTISLAAFYLGFVILNDFRNIFFLERDAWVIRGLPVSQKEITSAKILSSLGFSGVSILILLIPSVYFFSKYPATISESVVYSILTIEFTLTVCFALMLLFAVSLRTMKSSTFLFILFQIIFFVFIFTSTGIKNTHSIFGKSNIISDDTFAYFPQILYVNALESPLLILLTTLIMFAVIGMTVVYISKNLYNFSGESLPSKKNKEGLFKNILSSYFNFTSRLICKGNVQKVFYDLSFNIFRTSKESRLKLATLITLPLILAGIGYFTGAATFLDARGLKGLPFANEVMYDIFSPAILILLVFSLLSLIKLVKISDTNSRNVEWIFKSASGSVSQSATGALKFIVTGFILPVLFFLCLISITQTDIASLLLNVIYVFSVLMMILSLSIRSFKSFPFSVDSSYDNPLKNFGSLFTAVFIALVIFSVQILIFQNIIFVISLSIILIVFSSIKLNRKNG